MAHRIATSREIQQKTPPVKRMQYREFIRRLPCIVTGQSGSVEAAHLSHINRVFGHYGRGRGTRASDRWILPLSASQHRLQHSMNEVDYWRQTGINPWIACLVLWGIWSDYGNDAHDLCVDIMKRNYRWSLDD